LGDPWGRILRRLLVVLCFHANMPFACQLHANMPFACNSFPHLLLVYTCLCPIPSRIFWCVQFPFESSVTFRISSWTIFHSITWKIEKARNLKTIRNIQEFAPEYFPPTRRSFTPWARRGWSTSPGRHCWGFHDLPRGRILRRLLVEASSKWKSVDYPLRVVQTPVFFILG